MLKFGKLQDKKIFFVLNFSFTQWLQHKTYEKKNKSLAIFKNQFPNHQELVPIREREREALKVKAVKPSTHSHNSIYDNLIESDPEEGSVAFMGMLCYVICTSKCMFKNHFKVLELMTVTITQFYLQLATLIFRSGSVYATKWLHIHFGEEALHLPIKSQSNGIFDDTNVICRNWRWRIW